MTVILQRLLHWNGCSCAFTHKLALSTLFFKDCSHTGVIRLLQRKKSLKGIITTSASAFKTHTLLTVPSWQETSGWKWKIRHQAGFSVTVRDTSLPCWSDFSLTESPRTDVGLAHFLLSNTDTHSLRLSFMKLPVLVYICSVVTTSLVMGVNEKMSITSFGLWELRIWRSLVVSAQEAVENGVAHEIYPQRHSAQLLHFSQQSSVTSTPCVFTSCRLTWAQHKQRYTDFPTASLFKPFIR